MQRSVLILAPLAAVLCLLLSQSASAQNTLTYATVDVDADNNKIYGYAYTEPSYAAGLYYSTTYVGAKLRDASWNELAAATKQGYGRSEVYLEASTNNNGPYKIQTGHYLFLTYYVSNYWDMYALQYRYGYLDYFRYNYYVSPSEPGYPIFNIPWFFDFLGRSPSTVVPSINQILGTLLSEFLPTLQNSVTFKTAKVDGITRNFSALNNAELPLGDTANGGSYCFGSASNPFTLVLDFDLPPDTSVVHTDSRSFMSEDTAKDQYSRISPLQFSNISLSPPAKGKVSVSMHRKRPPENFSNNRVKITVAGAISGGGSFSSTGRVRLTCP